VSPKIKAVCLACIEPTVQRAVRRYLEGIGLLEDYYTTHRVPGGSFNIVSTLRDIGAVVSHFGATRVFLFDHEDCFIYRSLGNDSEAAHIKSLKKAGRLIQTTYPGVTEVRIFFMRKIPAGGGWKVEEVTE